MQLYNEWLPAEATIDIDGKMVNIRCPSKIALFGALGHLCTETNHLFLRNVGKARPIDYVVDVGANVGATALLFQRAFPDARILAIEPASVNYDCLLHNIKDFSQIVPLKMAAFDKRAEIRLSMPTLAQRPDLMARFGNAGLFSVYGEDTKHSEKVCADKLDDIVDGRVDFLKIDVEGAEALVLSGANRIMTEDRPVVVIEVRESNLSMSGHTIQEYRNHFSSLSYSVVGDYRGDVVLCPKEYAAIAREMP